VIQDTQSAHGDEVSVQAGYSITGANAVVLYTLRAGFAQSSIVQRNGCC
jgi:hypothetical protein